MRVLDKHHLSRLEGRQVNFAMHRLLLEPAAGECDAGRSPLLQKAPLSTPTLLRVVVANLVASSATE
jgi:hypothetical protein